MSQGLPDGVQVHPGHDRPAGVVVPHVVPAEVIDLRVLTRKRSLVRTQYRPPLTLRVQGIFPRTLFVSIEVPLKQLESYVLLLLWVSFVFALAGV